jgi:mono/diheme cytochrome c family protein
MLKMAADRADGSWQMAEMRQPCHQPSAVWPSGRLFQRPARGRVIFSLAAVTGIVLNFAVLAMVPAAAAEDPKEIYTSVYNGWKWWHVYCYRCHGTDANGTPLAPNLTDPTARLPLKEFLQDVRNGFPDEGMQAWNKLLDDKQITQLWYYVQARTDKVLKAGRPDEVGPNGGPWVPPAGWPKK